MIHLLTGENTFETQRRLRALLSDFDGDVEKVDGSELSLEQLPDLLAGVTLFSSKRLVVIKNASQNKSIWMVLGEWFEKGIDNDVVLVETNPDKRTKTYKWLEKNAEVSDAKALQPFEVVQWVVKEARSKHVELPRDTAELFVDYVGTDQWRLQNELEKLCLSGEKLSKELVQRLVEPTPQATSFELLDAAFQRQTEKLETLFETVSKNEDPYMFLGLLAGQIYALALVLSTMKRPDEIAKETGVHPFVLKKVSVLARTMSKTQLKTIVHRLSELDANMKSRSVEPWTQVRSFLNSLA